MSTLRVDNLNARTGTKITVPTGTTLYAPGHIVQVVQSTITSSISTTSLSMVASGLIASITPTYASSKILVSVSGGHWRLAGNGSNTEGWTQFYRSIGGGSYTAIGTAICEILVNYTSSQLAIPHSSMILDSPNTTSTVSYQPYFRAGYSGTIFFNEATVSVYLTLMEVAQ